MQVIFQEIKKLKPKLVIIDSIQTLHTSSIESSPGSISQIRECAAELQRFAKETNTPVFLIGHITKDGQYSRAKNPGAYGSIPYYSLKVTDITLTDFYEP
jgi:DNA repair protein RadA/Sms